MSDHHHAGHDHGRHDLGRHDHDQHHHDQHDHGHDDLPGMLDLDAEVLAEHLRAVRADVAALVDAPVRRLLDLGAGTGSGTFALLADFPDAHAVATDASPDMVERLQRRAADLGLTGRVTVALADLDQGLPDVDLVDLAWASASLHHLVDPDRTLVQVAAAIRPGGLLVVVELAGFPRFLPDGTPGGSAEAHAHALLAADRALDLPSMGSDWAPRLVRAGLVVEVDRAIDVDLAPPHAPVVRDYALATLTRVRSALAGRLEDTDLAHLDAVLDGGPDDVRHRADLHVTTQRRLLVARRPAVG